MTPFTSFIAHCVVEISGIDSNIYTSGTYYRHLWCEIVRTPKITFIDSRSTSKTIVTQRWRHDLVWQWWYWEEYWYSSPWSEFIHGEQNFPDTKGWREVITRLINVVESRHSNIHIHTVVVINNILFAGFWSHPSLHTEL